MLYVRLQSSHRSILLLLPQGPHLAQMHRLLRLRLGMGPDWAPHPVRIRRRGLQLWQPCKPHGVPFVVVQRSHHVRGRIRDCSVLFRVENLGARTLRSSRRRHRLRESFAALSPLCPLSRTPPTV